MFQLCTGGAPFPSELRGPLCTARPTFGRAAMPFRKRRGPRLLSNRRPRGRLRGPRRRRTRPPEAAVREDDDTGRVRRRNRTTDREVENRARRHLRQRPRPPRAE
jgi:hypothetical protein